MFIIWMKSPPSYRSCPCRVAACRTSKRVEISSLEFGKLLFQARNLLVTLLQLGGGGEIGYHATQNYDLVFAGLGDL